MTKLRILNLYLRILNLYDFSLAKCIKLRISKNYWEIKKFDIIIIIFLIVIENKLDKYSMYNIF